MRCPKCNHELDNNGNCPYCQSMQNVQTMSSSEANNYSGVTIEDENNFRKENSYQNRQNQTNTNYRQAYRPNSMKVRYIRLGGNSTSSWLTKGLIAIGGLAILGFFFFVALPVILTVLGAGIVAWLIFRFFKRY